MHNCSFGNGIRRVGKIEGCAVLQLSDDFVLLMEG
jgi:hypothetical protein